ncbi:MAG: GIY-YIG nuclease family protein [Candidatus Nanoarchaeia archaeon]
MKGIYILIINVRKNITLKVGALGKIYFKKGRYAYVGSAQNNIKKRIQRHLSKNKKKTWHIDYLLANSNVKVESVHYKKAKKYEECRIAHLLTSVEQSIKGFGSSDCKCHSHLFMIKIIKYFTKYKFKKLGNIKVEGNEIRGKC